MRMIYKQCNYSILLLWYDFEFGNVEIKTNVKLEIFEIRWLIEVILHELQRNDYKKI